MKSLPTARIPLAYPPSEDFIAYRERDSVAFALAGKISPYGVCGGSRLRIVVRFIL